MVTQVHDDPALRVTRLEHRVRMWRRVAEGVTTVAALAALTAFRGAAAPSIDAERLILHAPGGSRVIELSLTPRGELQAEFKGDSIALRQRTRGVALVLVDESGKEVARLGWPTIRHTGP